VAPPLLHPQENRKFWQRNAAVALGNQGDPGAIPALVSALEDPEPLVRAHAAWLWEKSAGSRLKAALEKRRALEEDGGVRRN